MNHAPTHMRLPVSRSDAVRSARNTGGATVHKDHGPNMCLSIWRMFLSMKTTILALLFAVLFVSARGQGTVTFTTKSGNLVNAPVTYKDGRLVTGTGPEAVLGQLYGAPVGAPLAALGSPTPFGSDVGAGYITAGNEIQIPGVSVGGSAQIKLVAWWAVMGSTYAEAVAKDLGYLMESPSIVVHGLGGGTTPPALLVGLQGFSLIPIPEPSLGALIILGATLLAPVRKARRL